MMMASSAHADDSFWNITSTFNGETFQATVGVTTAGIIDSIIGSLSGINDYGTIQTLLPVGNVWSNSNGDKSGPSDNVWLASLPAAPGAPGAPGAPTTKVSSPFLTGNGVNFVMSGGQSFGLWGGNDYGSNCGPSCYTLFSGWGETVTSDGHVNPTINYTGTFAVAPVPEADAYALMSLGMGLVGLLARRKKTTV